MSGISGIVFRAPGDPARASWKGAGPSGLLRAGGIECVAAGRLDNRSDLLETAGDAALADEELIFRAYLRFGERAPEHLYGDWAFAAWHVDEGRLFLARDHLGATALYYHAGRQVFAFSASRRELVELNLAPVELDELYVAQVVLGWNEYHGERTVHRPIRRLPPAHCLAVGPGGVSVRCYRRLEETPILELPDREAYVERFRELLDDAVRSRLGGASIGATLSGGLDSGAVTATAAGLLRAEGRERLRAFTWAPAFDATPYVGRQIGDETALARATARHAGHVDLEVVRAAETSPVQAIRRMLDIHDEPFHAGANALMILALLDAARDAGCDVLLTGQMGNAGISWTGEPASQSIGYRLREQGWRSLAGQRARRIVPPAILRARRRRREGPEWYRYSAIAPGLVDRLELDELRFARSSPPRSARERRASILMPGRTAIGAHMAQLGNACGLEIRDPTADARLVAFAFSVPDRIFIDPKTGVDRWLIRAALAGRLPDEVRLNRRRGVQSGDRVPRLRLHARDVVEALDEVGTGPGGAVVDVGHMRSEWRAIEAEDTPRVSITAATVVARGLAAGLWVNRFHELPRRPPVPPEVAFGSWQPLARAASS